MLRPSPLCAKNEGIAHWAGLPNLPETALMGGNAVTNGSTGRISTLRLAKIKSLETWGLQRTKATEAGRKRLDKGDVRLFVRE